MTLKLPAGRNPLPALVFAKTFLPEKIPAYCNVKAVSESEENSNGKQKYYEKNKESKKKLIRSVSLICVRRFFVGTILFVINVVTDYKTYTDSEIVKANVINVSGTKNGMLDVKYQYNYGGKKYEENVRQSVGEIRAGDEKEIRIRKSMLRNK